MPELPEVAGYVAGLEAHVVGQRLDGLRLISPFLLRTVEPAPDEAFGSELVAAGHVGKRVVLEFEEGLLFVIHPMISGRLRWKKPGAKPPGRAGLAALDFEHGVLMLTEQSSKKRASLHVVRGREALASLDPGGVEPLEVDDVGFRAALLRVPRTLKRALCDPRAFSGIGNGWSDEILFAARLSPFQRAAQLNDDEHVRLVAATRSVLGAARERHVAAARESFPDKVSAFQPEMAVHGRYGEACPDCGAPVQRVTFATRNEMNYCAGCQTGGRLLADRALSRLLKDDWPRTLEDLEGRA